MVSAVKNELKCIYERLCFYGGRRGAQEVGPTWGPGKLTGVCEDAAGGSGTPVTNLIQFSIVSHDETCTHQKSHCLFSKNALKYTYSEVALQTLIWEEGKEERGRGGNKSENLHPR